VDPFVFAVFVTVYAGMVLGGLPGLALDRSGVALLGAIALVASGRVSAESAWRAIDVPTIGLLFGLMVVSAQFRIGGFYGRFTAWLAEYDVGPAPLLALVMAASAALSALLANDIVCLAMAPILAEGLARRGLDPVPHLLALACASNIGSAATLIGNPQNMLIGQALDLSFATYLEQAALPTLAGLAIAWWIIARAYSGRWERAVRVAASDAPEFRAWQTTKGAVILTALVAAYLGTSVPREVVALGAAGLILTSRKVASSRYFAFIDWNLLVLFAGLFVVNHGVRESGLLDAGFAAIREAKIDITHPAWLFIWTVLLSNIVSNVPATMLLLPVATHPLAGPILALASTLAGNLIVVGSIANIIVLDQARRVGVEIGWWTHARIGIPVTLATLAIAALWLVVLAWMGAGAVESGQVGAPLTHFVLH